MAQSELQQLQDKRDRLASDLEDLDTQILELKKKRYAELQAEMESLGMNVTPATRQPSDTGKRKGRPKGSKLSPETIAKMKAGRAAARAKREGSSTEEEQPRLAGE